LFEKLFRVVENLFFTQIASSVSPKRHILFVLCFL
jgi:hypothetical protein